MHPHDLANSEKDYQKGIKGETWNIEPLERMKKASG